MVKNDGSLMRDKIYATAWMTVTKDGTLNNQGGNLAFFGLDNIMIKDNIKHKLDFLDGILSSDVSPSFIENLEIAPHHFTNIHLSIDENICWLLFSEIPEELNWKSIARQKANDLELLKSNRVEVNHIELSEILEVGIFEKVDNEYYNSVGIIPDKFHSFFSKFNNLDFEKLFPFLVNFLKDSEKHWNNSGTNRIKSGPWVELDIYGQDMALEATSLLWEGRKILLIEILNGSYIEHLSTLQIGRNIVLKNELLEQTLLNKKKLNKD